MKITVGSFGPFVIPHIDEQTAEFCVAVELQRPHDDHILVYGSGHLPFLHQQVGEYGQRWYIMAVQGHGLNKAVYFRNLLDAIHYRLRWADAGN